MVKNLSAMQGTQVQFLAWEDPLEKEMATPILLPGESQEQRSLAGYSPWGCKELDMTEWLAYYVTIYMWRETNKELERGERQRQK